MTNECEAENDKREDANECEAEIESQAENEKGRAGLGTRNDGAGDG